MSSITGVEKSLFHAKYPDWLNNPQCLIDALELFKESGMLKPGQFDDIKGLLPATKALLDIAAAEGVENPALVACINKSMRIIMEAVNPDPAAFIRSMIHHERMPPRKKPVNEWLFFGVCITVGIVLAALASHYDVF